MLYEGLTFTVAVQEGGIATEISHHPLVAVQEGGIATEISHHPLVAAQEGSIARLPGTSTASLAH